MWEQQDYGSWQEGLGCVFPSLILLQLPMPPPAFPEFYRLSLCRKLDAQQQGSAVKGSSMRGSHHVFSPLLSHDYLQEEGVQHPCPFCIP